MHGLIYSIINKHSGKIYIGSTRQKWNIRRSNHWTKLIAGKHHSPHLQNSYSKWSKSGLGVNDIFEFVVIEDNVDLDDLISREQFHLDNAIQRLGSDMIYNSGICADNPRTGLKHTEETKSKIRAAHKNKTLTQEHKDNLSKSLKGRKCPWMEGKRGPMSEEHKQNISKSLSGRKLSESHCEQIRNRQLGKPTGRTPVNGFQKGHTPWNKKSTN